MRDTGNDIVRFKLRDVIENCLYIFYEVTATHFHNSVGFGEMSIAKRATNNAHLSIAFATLPFPLGAI
ncbi:MAG: hypothetical protein BGO25_03585 [Acidobacteriales bacterium 59-55]|nr:MAG: hypothetical protein BGO25_03585 [Acidobacteriales bacterium 59-55]